MFHVKQRRLLHYGSRYARRHYPLRQHFTLSIGAVQALFISDLLFALAIQSPSTPNRIIATSDHPTLAAINLRARHLFCTQERLLAGRRRSFELNHAHYTH